MLGKDEGVSLGLLSMLGNNEGSSDGLVEGRSLGNDDEGVSLGLSLGRKVEEG